MTAEEQHRPQRILHIGKYFPPHRGGMETALRDQINMQIRDEGRQVAAVVHSSERRLTDQIDIQPLGYRVRHAARWFTTIFAPIAPFFAWSVYQEIRILDPDEIKIHMPNPSAFWLFMVPSAWRRRWVILWHSDVLPSSHSSGLRLFYRFYQPFETLLLNRADQIIATSPPYLETSKPLRSYRDKCVVEPLEIDIERIPRDYREASQPPKAPNEGIRVLCIGRLTYYKDFGTAIRAVAAIANAQLHIVGEGEERRNLEVIIQQLGVGNRVKLLGELPDKQVWKEYVWCDVHVLPSIERTEAYGLVLLEASVFGKTNLVSEITGSGVIFAARQSRTRFLTFPPGHDEKLSRILPEASSLQENS